MSTSLSRDLTKLRSVIDSLENPQIKAGLNDFVRKWEMENSKTGVEQGVIIGEGIEATKAQILLHADKNASWGFQKWIDSRVVPGNPLEALTLGIHCLLLENKFTNMIIVPSTIPGFASSIRELNPSKFIPDQWNSIVLSEGLLYKHSSARNPFQLVISETNENEATITFSQKSKLLYEKNLNVESLIYTKMFGIESLTGGTSISPYDMFCDLERLKNEVVVPLIASSPEEKPIPTSALQTDQRNMEAPPCPERSGGVEVPVRIPPVGESDLNPIAIPDYNHRPHVHPFSDRDGSLVGPGHPIFGADPSGLRDRDPGYPAFPRAPQPRFDPYGPVPGANGPDLGGGIPGLPWSGEPEPDHLKPPGVPDLEVQPPSRFAFERDPRDQGRSRPGDGLGGGRIFER